MLDRAAVQVPATSANLGPGFDCLGLALNLYLRVHCRVRTGTGVRITVGGPEAGHIARGPSNHVYRAMLAVFSAAGSAMPMVELKIENGIPLSRGLGSSAAAYVAGLVLANAIGGFGLDRQRLLAIGLPLEGHPDNLAPALFGGLAVSAGDVSLVVPLPRPPRVVLFIPDFIMSTSEARQVLPSEIPRADAVFNTGRSALLVAALAGGNLPVLRLAMEDRLHQPYRSGIFPALPALITAALEAGAAGAALSGAGSTIIAFCEDDPSGVAVALEKAAASLNVPGRSMRIDINTEGAKLL